MGQLRHAGPLPRRCRCRSRAMVGLQGVTGRLDDAGGGVGMTGIEVILAALAAGAAAGTTDAAKTAVLDAYSELRDVLRSRLTGRKRATQMLDAVEAEPGRW